VKRRTPQAGLTLIEIMVASAVMVIMMSLAWRTISNTSDARRSFEAYEQRNHELRMALDRTVRDFEEMYLSANEDQTQSHRRTMLIAKARTPVPDVRFSTLGHRPLWADAHESDQTVIEYVSRQDPDHNDRYDWIRREQRRQSNQPPEEEPSDYDILAHDIVNVKLEFWNWKNLEWIETWDTTQSDGQRGFLPSRVRITITYKNGEGKELKLTTEARVQMQEQLLLSPT
jgi:prepilin-type N-terminal cleavage/methylation domain-containing protein